MTFPRIRAPGLWVLGSVWAPSEAEAFDDHQSKAVDGYLGGAYSPTGQLVFGGAGLNVTGPCQLGNLTACTLNGTLTSTVLGVIAVANGSTLNCQIGSQVNLNGASRVTLGGTLSIGDPILGVGTLSCLANGTITCAAGSTLSSAGTVQLTGTVYLQPTGLLSTTPGSVVSCSGTVILGPSSVMALLAGATVNDASTRTVSGGSTHYQTGSSVVFDAGSALVLYTTPFLGATQPTPTADPGANALTSTGQVKAWGYIQLNGDGTATILDGYNITSVTIPSSAYVVVTLTRQMATANWGISGGYVDAGSANAATAVSSNPTQTTVRIHLFQVAGTTSEGTILNPLIANGFLTFFVCGRQ